MHPGNRQPHQLTQGDKAIVGEIPNGEGSTGDYQGFVYNGRRLEKCVWCQELECKTLSASVHLFQMLLRTLIPAPSVD